MHVSFHKKTIFGPFTYFVNCCQFELLCDQEFIQRKLEKSHVPLDGRYVELVFLLPMDILIKMITLSCLILLCHCIRSA